MGGPALGTSGASVAVDGVGCSVTLDKKSSKSAALMVEAWQEGSPSSRFISVVLSRSTVAENSAEQDFKNIPGNFIVLAW